LEDDMLLAVDTSTPLLGIALYKEPQVTGELTWRTNRHHSVELAPAVNTLLGRCSLKPLDVECVAVALGPGSFTSLRIGLAFAKGFALSLKIPIIGIPTFEFLAAAQPPSGSPMLLVLPAGRSRLAVQWFHHDGIKWQGDQELRIMTPDEISDVIDGPTIICGEMDGEDRQIIGRKWKNARLASPVMSTRRPALLAELAWRAWKSGNIADPVSLSPIYLHIAEEIQE
jgi:tRNA threonylcarbamoyladenosine biosynthesis protein TsaB